MSDLQVSTPSLSYYQNHCPSFPFLQKTFPHQVQCPTLDELGTKWGISNLKPLSSYKITIPFVGSVSTNLFSYVNPINWLQNSDCIHSFQDELFAFIPTYIPRSNQLYNKAKAEAENGDYWSKIILKARTQYFHDISPEKRARCYPNAHYMSLADEGKPAEMIDFIVRHQLPFLTLSKANQKKFVDKMAYTLQSLFPRDVFQLKSMELEKIVTSLLPKALIAGLLENLDNTQKKELLNACEDLGYDLNLSTLLDDFPELSFLSPLIQGYNSAILVNHVNSIMHFAIHLAQQYTATLGLSSDFAEEISFALPTSFASVVLDRDPNFELEMPFLHALINQDEEKAIACLKNGHYIPHQMQENLSQLSEDIINLFQKALNEKDHLGNLLPNKEPEIFSGFMSKFLDKKGLNAIWDVLKNDFFTSTESAPSQLASNLKFMLTSPVILSFIHGASEHVLEAIIEHHPFSSQEASAFLFLTFLTGKKAVLETALRQKPEIFTLVEELYSDAFKSQRKTATQLRKLLRLFSEKTMYNARDEETAKEKYIIQFYTAILLNFIKPKSNVPTNYLDDISTLIDFIPDSEIKREMVEMENLLTEYYENGKKIAGTQI